MARYAKLVLTPLLILIGFAILYHRGIVKLVYDWGIDDNYSHGYLIVPVALYLAWERRDQLAAAVRRPSALGLVVLALSVAVLGAGVLGAELFLTRISMLGALAGAILFVYGRQHLRILAFPLAFLLLMIPIPAIIFNPITLQLQLLASRFAETALVIAGVPVLREGNVMVLASTKLEVAEACSGIRSLISLLTLAIVYGYVTDRRGWARVALALASIPVAIIANGFRVAGTGLLAHFVSPKAAEGFFHEFSGWLVFVVAFVMLFAVQRLLAWLAPDRTPPVAEAPPDPPSPDGLRRDKPAFAGAWRALVVTLVLVSGAVAISVASESEAPPPRESLATFPMEIAEWRGRSADRFDQNTEDTLRASEYLTRIYAAPTGDEVAFFIGYYESQRQGETMHSPRNCMPGSGWQFVTQERVSIPVATRIDTASGQAAGQRDILVNRFVIENGPYKHVVLYWYQSHGRIVASEFWGKIYTVVDAIRLNRTDAAMVRVTSRFRGGDPAAEARAEQAATAFVKAMFPSLGRYLPE